MNAFEEMKIELEVVVKNIGEVNQEIAAIHATRDTSAKLMDNLSRLKSKLSVLDGRSAELKAGLPAAEYAVFQSVSDDREAKMNEAKNELDSKIEDITDQLAPLFDYKEVRPSFRDIVNAAKPVHEAHSAYSKSMNAFNHAKRLEVVFAFDNGLAVRK